MLAFVIAAVAAEALGQASGQPDTAVTETATTRLPLYDVVSIKVNKSGGNGVDTQGRLDSLTITNIPFKSLLANAYDIREDLISGVTGPVASARFDVLAKIVEPDLDAMKKLTPRQRQSMMLPILTERFQLKAHTEIKSLPVYELSLVPSGPKFKKTPADSPEGSHSSMNTNKGRAEWTVGGYTMQALAKRLAEQLHRTVIDKTGLEGRYDLALTWSTDDNTEENPQSPSIFTAVQEQLGLKLQPAKGPVETLVVDHVEMPSEN